MNKKRRVAQLKHKKRKAVMKEKEKDIRMTETGGRATPAPVRTRYEIEDAPEAAKKETKAKAAVKPATAKKKAETTAEDKPKAAAKPATAKKKAETTAEDKPKAAKAKAAAAKPATAEAETKAKPKKTAKKTDTE